MKTGFPLRPNVLGLILYGVLVTALVIWLMIWLSLLALEAVGREPAWSLRGLIGVPLFVAVIFRPLQLAVLAVRAVLRGDDALVITERAVDLFGPSIIHVSREDIEKFELRPAPRFPWLEAVVLHLCNGKRISILSYYFPGRGEAIMRALEAAPRSGGPWS